jgi:mono/diheme cytochrome c family protein
MTIARPTAVACLLALGACRTEQTLVKPDPQLDRMLKQEKVLPYDAVPFLPNGMAMQRPPDGTLPVDAVVGDPALTTGVVDGRWVHRIPVPVDRALVDGGRVTFERVCATCHGILGDGESAVAEKMSLRKPANLLGDDVRALPAGKIFRTIRAGYGLMPSFAGELSIGESWGAVAYLRALQLARGVPVARLPAELRARLAKEAP